MDESSFIYPSLETYQLVSQFTGIKLPENIKTGSGESNVGDEIGYYWLARIILENNTKIDTTIAKPETLDEYNKQLGTLITEEKIAKYNTFSKFPYYQLYLIKNNVNPKDFSNFFYLTQSIKNPAYFPDSKTGKKEELINFLENEGLILNEETMIYVLEKYPIEEVKELFKYPDDTISKTIDFMQFNPESKLTKIAKGTEDIPDIFLNEFLS